MNPIDEALKLKVEADLKKETPEYKAGKIFLFGVMIGWIIGILTTWIL